MFDQFYSLPIYLALLLIFVGCNLISVLGYFVSHRFLARVDNKDVVTKVVWQTVLFFTTIFITFWIATNWSNLGALKSATIREANSVQLLYHEMDGLNQPQGKLLQTELLTYAGLVVNDEYAHLRHGQSSPRTESSFRILVNSIYDYRHEGFISGDEGSYNRVLDQIEVVSDYRDTRLQYLEGNLQGPLLLFFIIMIVVGCFWTGFIDTKSRIFTTFIILCQNLIISASCWLILEMDKPFQGELSVGKSAFVMVYQQLEHKH